MVAPFWSDNDIRRAGAVRYAVINSEESEDGDEVLRNVNSFIRHQNRDANEENFKGHWMLVAYWDRVHPYPHGSHSNYYTNNGRFTDKVSYLYIGNVYTSLRSKSGISYNVSEGNTGQKAYIFKTSREMMPYIQYRLSHNNTKINILPHFLLKH